jgi:hypothetical protein
MDNDFENTPSNDSISRGFTGGPGMPGGPISTSPLTLVKGRSATPAELHDKIRNERIVTMLGFTGGDGLPGTIEINECGEITSVVSQDDEETLLNLTLKKIDTMDVDELKEIIVTNNDEINASIDDLEAENGYRAYTIGKALMRTEYLFSSRNMGKGFEQWCEEHLSPRRMKSRTRKKFCDIARIPDALDYLVVGSEKLAALAPILKRVPGLESNHPIRDFVEKYEVNLKDCADVGEMRFEIGVGMDMAKLKLNKIEVPKENVRKFHECGFEMTKKDIEAMQAIATSGGTPAKYLDQVIENKKRPTVTTSNSSALGKNILEQAQELRDTVATILKAPTVSKDIQVDRIDALIKDLEALKFRLSGSQGMTPETAASPPPVVPENTGAADIAAASNE